MSTCRLRSAARRRAKLLSPDGSKPPPRNDPRSVRRSAPPKKPLRSRKPRAGRLLALVATVGAPRKRKIMVIWNDGSQQFLKNGSSVDSLDAVFREQKK